MYSAEDGSATGWHLQHWMQYGYSGAGLARPGGFKSAA